MGNEMSTISGETIAQISEYLNGAENFVAEQVPLVCQEILRYGIADAIFTIVIFGIIGVTSYRIGKRMLNTNYDTYSAKTEEAFSHYKWHEYVVFGRCLFWIGSCASIFFILFSICQIMKIILAPRLYILKNLADLVNGA